jgi:YidC/Oxa1 family membrane protein insertase
VGFLNPLYDFVAWAIMHIFGVLSPVLGATGGLTWVLTIVILVVLMRLLLLPLFIKQMHTQRAMTALAPKITEIRNKYKGDRETQNAEMMKLYQEAGVNPLMGCLPVLLQLPLFFALFSVLRAIASATPLYGMTASFVHNAGKASIFGAYIKDKVLFTHGLYVPFWPGKFVILVVVAISMVTTYLTMRQSVKRGMMPASSDTPMGQQQKIMTYVMPLFALTGLYWPLGLVLYWVTTNLWTLGQQFVLLRKYPVGAAVLGGDGKMATGGRPSAGGKPAGGSGGKMATGSGAKTAGGSGGTAKPKAGGPGAAGANGQAGKGGKAGGGRTSDAKPKAAGASREPAGPNGQQAGGGAGAAGVLRRFSRGGRTEPEPQATSEPAAKIVRQQRTRQSRSKRSGKR